MVLAGPEFNETPGAQFWATFNPEFAEVLFQDTGHTFAELAALGKDRLPMPRFPFLASLRATTRTNQAPVGSRNIVAVIPGSCRWSSAA